MVCKDLKYYEKCFSTLHTAKSKGQPAPHKALLILSVIDVIEQGLARNNRIYLTDELERKFKANTKMYIGTSILFTPKITTPFYHMNSEPFWNLVRTKGREGLEIKNPYSKKALQSEFQYVEIDSELFQLLQNPDACAKLRICLILNYLKGQPTAIDTKNMLLPLILATSLIA